MGKDVSERPVVSTCMHTCTHIHYTHKSGGKRAASIHKLRFTPFRNMHIYFVPNLPFIFLILKTQQHRIRRVKAKLLNAA